MIKRIDKDYKDILDTSFSPDGYRDRVVVVFVSIFSGHKEQEENTKNTK